MTIKRLYAKFKISLRDISKKSFAEREEAKTNAKQCSFICRKLIHSQNSDLLIAPISRKKYIKNTVFPYIRPSMMMGLKKLKSLKSIKT